MSESDSVSDDRRCSSSDYADTSTSDDCQVSENRYICSSISLPEIDSAEVENKAIKLLDSRTKLRWNEIESNLNNSSLVEFNPSPNYHFSRLPSSEYSAGLRLNKDAIVLHYDHFVAGLRPPIDPFFVECLMELGSLPCDFAPNTIRIIFAFTALCRLLGYEPSLAVFLQFYSFCKIAIKGKNDPTRLWSVRYKKHRLFYPCSPKIFRWYERAMVVESLVGWPFEKFDPLSLKSTKTVSASESLEPKESELINKLKRCLGWNGSSKKWQQKWIFSWRDIIDISQPFMFLAGIPGPLSPGTSPLVSNELFEPATFITWYAKCHHNICYPSECVCKGAPPSPHDSIMSPNVSRKLIGEKLRAERLRKEGVLSEQSSKDLPLLISTSKIPPQIEKSSIQAPSGSVTRGQKRILDESQIDKNDSTAIFQKKKKDQCESVGALALATNNVMSPPMNPPLGHLGIPALWLDPIFMKSDITENWISNLSNSIADVIPIRDVHPWPLNAAQLGIGYGLIRRILQEDTINDNTSSSFTDCHNLLVEASGMLGLAASEIGSKIATAQKILRRSEEQSNLALSSSKDATLEARHESTNFAIAFDAEMTKMKTLLKSKDDQITSKNAELTRLQSAHIEELRSLQQDNEKRIQEAEKLAEIRLKEVASKEYDDGVYHMIRCFRHFMNCKPPLSMLAEMLSTDPYWPDLRVHHPDIPYSEKLLDTFRKTHQDKMWKIPPINKENLRSLMKTLEKGNVAVDKINNPFVVDKVTNPFAVANVNNPFAVRGKIAVTDPSSIAVTAPNEVVTIFPGSPANQFGKIVSSTSGS